MCSRLTCLTAGFLPAASTVSLSATEPAAAPSFT
eukprot:CAMPEP_0185612670 /NCGR_PEP_ID=MMETSP0436-20130131/23020_1 /TAXON_ID=626734 ORGANISM="Favella taraikaensis, Strain Fe Narragansett Bay" /NCGR_SAMPLE_ID=MMETSP0436 /ASSEMBLY_ACC=CAM_ASM_000390 /LENGTH=33 /DNA_ID= /DNA_START= /DNA_END= /DNA_ORIENTATION=